MFFTRNYPASLQRQRFEEISVSDLCEQMNIPRKSFYRYFSSKEGALFSLLDHTIMELYDSIMQDDVCHSSPVNDLHRFFRFWYDHRDLLDALDRSSLSGLLVQRAMFLAQEEQPAAAHITKPGTDLQGLALPFTVCGLMSIVFQWHLEGFQIEPEALAHTAARLLSHPLMPNT